jgi:beta-galactosidase
MTDLSTSTVELRPTGLVLDGREEALLCASLFYFRLPRETWEARLAQVRATGYRAIDVYLPWNFHETAPGVWDFAGRRDVGAFLDLAHEAGLAVIARPGPYICSEWDGGALPAWLGLDEDLRLRQAEPKFLEQVRGWFDRAMPLLAERQWGRGGAVVAVQLENELDFFDTADRHAYISALRDMGRGHGIEVPLIACAGQGDLVGANGDVEGVAPAFNFYPDDRSPFVEAEVRRYADLVASRGLPLLVTETNRSHATLRRLMVSGATLIAPYLQASGYDFGYTPSVGNWGDPGGFMTHDYDFGGYLSPVGEARPETAEARVLTAFARTLGPALAKARTTEAEGVQSVSVTTSSSPSRLVLDGGGTVTGVPNLSEETGFATIGTAGIGEVVVALAPRSCALILQELPLAGFGLPGVLRFASADLVGADETGLRFASRVASSVGLSADGETSVVAELGAPEPGKPVQYTVRFGAVQWEVVVLHPEDVADPDGAKAEITGPAGEPETITAASKLELATRSGEAAQFEVPPVSEAVGVYRGRTHYATALDGVEELLIEGSADIVDLALDGEALPTRVVYGATTVVPTAGKTALAATVETWGHANFDDSRLPGLALSSLRGLGRVWSVEAREDVHALWTVDGGSQWAGDPAPVRSLGGWSSTRIGRPATYRRALPVDGTSHYAFHIDGLTLPVEVSVDGAARIVSPIDPWVHLHPGQGREIAVTAPHWPGSGSGAVELLRLAPVENWQVEAQPDSAIIALAGQDATGTGVELPLELAPGEEVWLDVPVPDGGQSLRFEGEQVRLSAFAGGELLGRVWLDDPHRPRFTGGDPARLWIPAAWNSGTVRLLVRGTAGGAQPRLAHVTATAAPE